MSCICLYASYFEGVAAHVDLRHHAGFDGMQVLLLLSAISDRYTVK